MRPTDQPLLGDVSTHHGTARFVADPKGNVEIENKVHRATCSFTRGRECDCDGPTLVRRYRVEASRIRRT